MGVGVGVEAEAGTHEVDSAEISGGEETENRHVGCDGLHILRYGDKFILIRIAGAGWWCY